MTTQDALHHLEELVYETNQAERERTEKSLSSIAFTIYYLVRRSSRPDPAAVALLISEEQPPLGRAGLSAAPDNIS